MNYGIHDEAADRPGNRQCEEDQQCEIGIQEADEPRYCRHESCSGEDEREILRQIEAASYLSEWSGELPSPDHFNQYPDYAQKAMVAWNDARVLGESARQDKLVEAVIKESHRSTILNFALHIIFVACAMVSFVVTNDPASFGFLAIPGVSVAVNIVQKLQDKTDE